VKGPVTGLFYGGGASQLFAEMIGVLANITWVGTTAFVFYKLVDKVVGMRVPAQDEIDGLDIPEMGVEGYSAEPGKVIPPEMAGAGVALPAMKVAEEPA
jgi:Amt family ammonium transporter